MDCVCLLRENLHLKPLVFSKFRTSTVNCPSGNQDPASERILMNREVEDPKGCNLGSANSKRSGRLGNQLGNLMCNAKNDKKVPCSYYPESKPTEYDICGSIAPSCSRCIGMSQ